MECCLNTDIFMVLMIMWLHPLAGIKTKYVLLKTIKAKELLPTGIRPTPLQSTGSSLLQLCDSEPLLSINFCIRGMVSL